MVNPRQGRALDSGFATVPKVLDHAEVDAILRELEYAAVTIYDGAVRLRAA